MFTVLQAADGKTGRKRRRAQPELVRVPVPGGSFFYVLRMPRQGDAGTLFRLAARCAPVVLTTLPVPPDAGVRLFRPTVFPLRRAACALQTILPRTGLPPQKLSLGVLDPDGALRGAVQTLLPLASDVRVVTRDARQFDPDARSARRRFGAPLTVGEDASLLRRCDAVVCPAPDEAFRDVPVVLSCEAADGAFSLLPVCLPDSLARSCPASVPPDLFAAALAERCGVQMPELFACRGTVFDAAFLDVCGTAALWRLRIRKHFS